jgi:hypothetical protein
MFTRVSARLLNIHLFCIICSLLLFPACTGAFRQPVKNPDFMDHLFTLQGKQMAGMVIHPSGPDEPFKGERIWLEVKSKGRKEIRLPIYRDQKIYRTLILGQDEQGYFLQHENKKDNGLQAEISMYGGHSTGVPSPFILVFPADAYSRQLLGSLRENVWSLAFNNERSVLSYIVEENGHVTLQIDFELPAPMQKRSASRASAIDLPENAFRKKTAFTCP